jgi:sterol desaturase/sphingolipid hydroxylase (fatty acid hydroxylase superfamily)
MSEWLLTHEPQVRLSCFFGVLGLMAIWELVAPRRALTASKALRWASNLGIVVLNSILLRLLFPAAAMGMALLAAERHWGLLNNVTLPAGLEIIAAVVALDFAIYLQHILFHAVPALWRLHRVHHADLDFDVTTGARFHPIEIVLSMLIKFAVIAALGPAPLAVLIFEVLLNATAMFNHSNVRIPLGIDRALRWLVVTPDMHRVHHSIEDHETNSNFGFNLPLWDRLFGTYKDQPDAGHDAMTIGIRELRAPRLAAALPGMLWLPFVGKVSDYAINRRTWKKNT